MKDKERKKEKTKETTAESDWERTSKKGCVQLESGAHPSS
jgi:hypothetical protein